MSKLIKCGDHKLAPPTFVCKHLMSGDANSYYFFPDDEQGSYVCCHCVDNVLPEDCEIHMVCIHCARQLVKGLTRID